MTNKCIRFRNSEVTPILLKDLTVNGIPFSQEAEDETHTMLTFKTPRLTRLAQILEKYIDFGATTATEVLDV